MFPARNDVGEADLLPLRPVDHRRGECPRLSDERYMSVVRHRPPEACVDPEARHHHPETVRTEHAHTVEAGRSLGDSPLERGACLAGLAEPRRQDRHGRYSGPPAFIHDVRHRRRRRADHGKVGCRRRVTHARVGLHPVDGLTLRVDRVDDPLVARLEQVAQDDVSHVRGRRAGSDDGYAAGCEQLVEVANAHIRPSGLPRNGSENPLGQLHHPGCVAPLVVVPGDYLHLGSVDDARQGGVEDG